ncbi:TetR/AcrR family transcriptional regulator [Jiangella rhizosphaerae]|uniref:TetR/AcrR family transcriptional regulator n=1 Tax=Jiangella rhizosphaerae TaxID=2293569 RepID=A0A418KWX2_9ACTN|nr:TetR/AcrR family transcriptional regulator [Jiangella rhizosphaerae]RIQ34864.1 TetR/AcrR family transcriptional regulator [Jiangella rhizosphaerae]
MTPADGTSTRDRILRAAAELLEREGREAVSTRAVGAAAGVQAPTLYRLFGDMNGLLDAVAAYGFEEYLRGKRALAETDDPVADLSAGWDRHVEFGLARPAFYVLMYGNGRPADESPAGREAAAVLRRLLSRVAAEGRLTMSVDRAARLVHATGVGVVLTLIATPEAERDLSLSELARDSVLRTVVAETAAPPAVVADPVTARSVALREALRADGDGSGPLTAAERALLEQWLDRLAGRR